MLEQYEPEQPPQRPLPAEPMAAALQLTFPTVVTPYGMAALIALLAATRDSARYGVIFAIVFAVMLVNLLAMAFAGRVMHDPTAVAMRLAGAVLGVLQVILAIEIILRALQELGVGT